MDITRPFTGTTASNWLRAGFFFGVVLLISTLLETRLMQSNDRERPNAWLHKSIFITGKVAAALASALFFLAKLASHNQSYEFFFGLLTLVASSRLQAALSSVKRRRFVGSADILSPRRNRPTK